MYLKGKNVLVLGLGVSGISIIKALNKTGARITVSDDKDEDALKDTLNMIKDIPIRKCLNKEDIDFNDIDLVIKSPGIPPSNNLVRKAIDKNIEVITDIELAYRLSPSENIIAITGTNGKTTTTILTGEVIKSSGYNTYLTGNIGTPILEKIVDASKEDVFVVEVSSFQLEHTKFFKPKISLILNITPDHLDWHGSFDNYKNSKLKVFANQSENDYTVLNYDDEILRTINDLESNIIWFSINEKLEKGIYLEGEFIVINDGKNVHKLISCNDLKIPGKHNLQNALGSLGILYSMGIDLDIIADVFKTFEGVEHRIEYVASKKGIKFYNDSKGTNIDASIKAIEAVKSPIILIAGGYDKGSEFEEFIKAFKNKVKALVLLGETREKIKKAAISQDFNHIFLVEDMKEAVELSYEIGEEGDNVLLSPACASWGMYNNFEERGKDFKNYVLNLKED